MIWSFGLFDGGTGGVPLFSAIFFEVNYGIFSKAGIPLSRAGGGRGGAGGRAKLTT